MSCAQECCNVSVRRLGARLREISICREAFERFLKDETLAVALVENPRVPFEWALEVFKEHEPNGSLDIRIAGRRLDKAQRDELWAQSRRKSEVAQVLLYGPSLEEDEFETYIEEVSKGGAVSDRAMLGMPSLPKRRKDALFQRALKKAEESDFEEAAVVARTACELTEEELERLFSLRSVRVHTMLASRKLSEHHIRRVLEEASSAEEMHEALPSLYLKNREREWSEAELSKVFDALKYAGSMSSRAQMAAGQFLGVVDRVPGQDFLREALEGSYGGNVMQAAAARPELGPELREICLKKENAGVIRNPSLTREEQLEVASWGRMYWGELISNPSFEAWGGLPSKMFEALKDRDELETALWPGRKGVLEEMERLWEEALEGADMEVFESLKQNWEGSLDDLSRASKEL